MTILAVNPVNVLMQNQCTEVLVIDNSNEAFLDQAFDWGQEDATERIDMRGSDSFDGVALACYNEGYQAGLDLLLELEGSSDELVFMDSVLASLRNGTVKPMVRMTAAQLYEIENERIGASLCETPRLW